MGVEGSFGVSLPKLFARGETGGVRMGLLDMGEGGTKGKDSKIESPPIEAAVTTEEPDTLLS